MKLSVARIEELMIPFYEKAVKDKDVAAGTLCCKLEERLSMLLGLDVPLQSRVDVYTVERQERPSQHDQIRDAIMTVARGPNWRELVDEHGNDKDPSGPSEPTH